MSVSTRTSDRRVGFQWTLSDTESAQDVRSMVKTLESAGGDVRVQEPPTGVLPVAIPIIVFGVVVATALAEQVADWWIRRHEKGLLIHAWKNGKVDIKHIDIPYGQVIFIAWDGK